MNRNRNLGAWLFATGLAWLASAPHVGAAGYDVAFVRLTAPDKVTAHEVFAVSITLRNNGTQCR
jgi:hypothetical protein